MKSSERSLAAIRGLLLAAPLGALLAANGFLFPYVVPRAVLLRTLVLLAAGGVLLLAWRRGLRLDGRRDPLFGALLALLIVGALAGVLGYAPWQSIYGDLERMGGVVTGGTLLLYYVLLRSFFGERQWRWYFRITVSVAVVVALLVAAAAFLGRGPLHATIGNTGLLGVYLLFHLGFAAAAVVRDQGRDLGPDRIGDEVRDQDPGQPPERLRAPSHEEPRRQSGPHPREAALFAAALTPLGIGLVLAQNRSSLLGLLCGAVAGAMLLALHGSARGSPQRSARVRRWIAPLAALPLLLVSLPVANRLAPELELHERLPGVLGKAARAGSADSRDPVRLAAWRSGLMAFRDRPLLGYGPETYHLVWDRHGEGEAARFVGYATFDRAHNAYIDVLATTGLLGALAYLLVWVAALLLLLRALRRGALDPPEAAVWLGLLTGYAVYLFFWFEDVNSAVVWTATLAFIGGRGAGAPLLTLVEPGRRPLRRPLVVAGALAVALSLYLHAFETLRVSSILHDAAKPDPELMVEDVLGEYRAAFRSAAPQTRDALAGYLSYLGRIAPGFEQARADPYRAGVLDRSFQEAFRFVEEMQGRDPRDHHLFLSDAALSLLATRFYRTAEAYQRALSAAHRAAELAPNRLPPRFVLVEAYRLTGLHEQAMAQIDTAFAIAGERGDTRYYQARVLESSGDVLAAAEALQRAAELGHARGPLAAALMDSLAARGAHQAAAELGQAYLEVRRGPWPTWWRAEPEPEPGPGEVPADEQAVTGRLPLAALRAGDALLAAAAARRLALADSSASPAVERFLADLRTGRAAAWADAPAALTLMDSDPGRRP